MTVTDWQTGWLTQWSGISLRKLLVSLLATNSPNFTNQTRWPLLPTRSHFNSMPALSFYLLKIHLILSSHLRQNYPSCIFLFRIPHQNSICVSFFQHTCNMLRPSHVSCSDNRNNKFRTLQAIKSTQYAFLQFLSYSSSQACYLPQTLSTSNLVTFLAARWPTGTQGCSHNSYFVPLPTRSFYILFPPHALSPTPSHWHLCASAALSRSHKLSQPMFAPKAHGTNVTSNKTVSNCVRQDFHHTEK